MTLTLRAVSLNDQPLTQPITAHFDLEGGTIGRADHNTMALPDPERHISREQAEIVPGPAGFLIRNVGSSNPIIVRDQSLAHGESAQLAHNDRVRIGRYLLEVIDEPSTDEDAQAATRVRSRGEAPVVRVAAASAAPAAPDPLAQLSPGNPFSQLLGAAAPARLPEDFDPFAPPAVAVATPAPRRAAGAFDDLVPPSAAGSIDEMFGLQGRAGKDPLAGFLADAQPAAGPSTPSTDPLVLFGAAARVTPPPEIAPDRTPELHAAFAPPRPAAAPVQRAARPLPAVPATESVAEPPPAASAWSGEAGALWQAFCEGAGVRLAPSPTGAEDTMRLAGSLLHAAIAGTLELMAVRAATRHELRAQVTVIQPRNNNPLKFSPDAQAALEQLLQPPVRGFLPGPLALTEAMDDLVGHSIGTMAGTRSALEGVLARFAPPALEDKLVGQSVVQSLLPMARKARLWELYLHHYEGIRDEAQEDFHALFGKAFVAAYEQQLEQLRRERKRH